MSEGMFMTLHAFKIAPLSTPTLLTHTISIPTVPIPTADSTHTHEHWVWVLRGLGVGRH
jgi:hypothetical protein